MVEEKTLLFSGDVDYLTISDNESEFYNSTNSTGVLEDKFVPSWIVILSLIAIIVGACTNAVIVAALLKSRRNGTLFLILQLAFVDTITLYTAIVEIWSLNSHAWTFRSELCPLFLGTETLTNTLNLYLIVCLNFHVISFWNLYKNEKEKPNVNPLTSCNNSIECLVTKSDSTTRNVTLNYKQRKNDVSVILPSIFVWTISLSLSVPEYTLASTLKIPNIDTLCTIIDLYYIKILHHLFLLFRVILPVPLLLSSFLILSWKFFVKKLSKEETQTVSSPKKSIKIEALLLFCIILNCLYVFTSLQRQIFYSLHIFTKDFATKNLNVFKTPPLYNIFVSYYLSTHLSILHYSSCLIRPILYIFLMPKFKFLIKSKLCFTYKNKK